MRLIGFTLVPLAVVIEVQKVQMKDPIHTKKVGIHTHDKMNEPRTCLKRRTPIPRMTPGSTAYDLSLDQSGLCGMKIRYGGLKSCLDPHSKQCHG